MAGNRRSDKDGVYVVWQSLREMRQCSSMEWRTRQHQSHKFEELWMKNNYLITITNAMSQSSKLARLPSIRDRVEGTLSAHRNELVSLLSRYSSFSSSNSLYIHRWPNCWYCVCTLKVCWSGKRDSPTT
jgi:hypothetical protein